jgi:hypothetical protein
MANVSHASLTGTQLHEPKGVETAALGSVYVSNGAGSGSWNDIGSSSFTGMIADFVAPLPPTGWLELNGSTISTSTYAGLYAVMTVPTSGTRTNSSAVVTSIPSTTNFRVGYYVFGTGISSGTTILSIDSATQVTLSAAASSSGTASFVVSPWLLNTGTIKLPDLTTVGRYRRSRTSSTKVGDVQTSQNVAHTHAVTGTTDNESVAHTHNFSGGTGAMTANASHSHTQNTNTVYENIGGPFGVTGSAAALANPGTLSTGTTNTDHTHNFSGTTATENTLHVHTMNFTSGSTGSTETRPESIVVLTCVKT